MALSSPLATPAYAALDLGQGRTLRLTAQLGRGSCATVYRATWQGSLGLQRDVAVKVFDPLASDELGRVLEALVTATNRWACVRHPNVVRLEDLGLLGPGRAFAVMELVEGRTLERALTLLARRRERMALDVALFIGLEVAEALAGARLATSADRVRLALVHGELAPCDVLLSWLGEVKVADFGLGSATRVSSSIRMPGALARRMRALAPEVACGRAPDARSDVFSLGVLLHETLVGPRFPPPASERETLGWARDGVVHQNMFQPRPPPSVRAVLRRALERDPARRYPHAGALAYDLRCAATALGVGDGRAFLRTMLARAFGDEGAEDDEATGQVHPPPLPLDRFARLRGEASSAAEREEDGIEPDPRESGTLLVCAPDDDDDAKEA